MCCFCGGVTIATEEDHIPARAVFTKRAWPEGYVFPACEQCNRASSLDELVVAMLSRTFPGPSTESETRELEQCVQAGWNNVPELMEEMRPSANLVRRGLRKYHLRLEDGMSTSDALFLKVGPLVQMAVEGFARKLFLALYYKHRGQPLPSPGGIAINWWSNIEMTSKALPPELFALLRHQPNLVRCHTSLDDQFDYRYALAEEGSAMFVASFRQSFVIAGFIRPSRSSFPASIRTVPPFEWA